MKQKELTELSYRELLQEQKKIKSGNIVNACLIGLLAGIAVYSAVKNGVGFFTFFPLFFAFILFKKRGDTEAVENEIKARNLNKPNAGNDQDL